MVRGCTLASLEVEPVSRKRSNLSTSSGILQNFHSAPSPVPDMFLGLLLPESYRVLVSCELSALASSFFRKVSGVKTKVRFAQKY